MGRDVVVLSAVRSAVGTFGGALAGIEPAELAGLVMREAVARSAAEAGRIGYVTLGTCIPTDARYPYVARVASIQAGLPMGSVAMQVNRLCSSGLQAIVSSAQNILLGGLLLFTFSLGMGALLVGVGTFSSFLTALPKSGPWLVTIKKILGLLMLGLAQYFFVKAGTLFL